MGLHSFTNLAADSLYSLPRISGREGFALNRREMANRRRIEYRGGRVTFCGIGGWRKRLPRGSWVGRIGQLGRIGQGGLSFGLSYTYCAPEEGNYMHGGDGIFPNGMRQLAE